jgi:hypothetical protein
LIMRTGIVARRGVQSEPEEKRSLPSAVVSGRNTEGSPAG